MPERFCSFARMDKLEEIFRMQDALNQRIGANEGRSNSSITSRPPGRSTRKNSAIAFLGSATLRDGEFHVFGTFIGALIIAFGFNGLNIFGAPTYSQYIFQGAILIIAVGLSSLGRILSQR